MPHASGQKERAGRSPLVKDATCPYTLSTYIHEFGNLGLLAEAGDHRMAVRGLTEAARGAGEVPRRCLRPGSGIGVGDARRASGLAAVSLASAS